MVGPNPVYFYTCPSFEMLSLQPGGLPAIQSLFLGLTNPYTLMHEVENNLGNFCLYLWWRAFT